LTAEESIRARDEQFEKESDAAMRTSCNQTELSRISPGDVDEMEHIVEPHRLTMDSFKGELKNYFRASLLKYKPG